ncbi:F-box protein [Artemisia annua]|uniref:F-box protein n=1 Tax=Artemisia annua TaxID=35608 RepID=A0A2U1LT71_ARTAN|nr:F-box protein [Artemisia annua]
MVLLNGERAVVLLFVTAIQYALFIEIAVESHGSTLLFNTSLFGIVGVTDKCLEALSKSCSNTITMLDVNGCIGIKKRSREELLKLFPHVRCFKVHSQYIIPSNLISSRCVLKDSFGGGYPSWSCGLKAHTVKERLFVNAQTVVSIWGNIFAKFANSLTMIPPRSSFTDADFDDIREEWAIYVSNFIFR